MRKTNIPLRHSLSYQQARNAVIAAFLIGLVLSTAQISFDYFSLQNEVRSEVSNIITTANRAAFHAAYNLDEIGAEQITRGLVSNRPIIEATVSDNFDNVLGSARTEHNEDISLIARWLFGQTRIIETPLREAPDIDVEIGRLEVQVDPAITGQTFIQRSVIVLISGIVRNFILALVLIAVFYYTFTRAILFASNRLQSGKTNERIPLPDSHKKDELGVLINAFNSHLGIIDDQHQQIIETNANLEQLVQTRTQQLDEKNRELDEEKNAALEASQAKSDFLAMMSHEIRTPMNGILGMAELLSKNTSDAQQLDYVEAILESGRSLLTLMNNVLDYSKFENQNLSFETIPLKPKRLVNSIIFLMSASAEKKHLLLTADVDPSVPETLMGDPERLRQVLLNLVSNAIKFTEEGRVALSVTSEASDQSGVILKFAISDSGIGVSKPQLNTLFDPFTQADSSISRRFGGTGMGLAICKQIVEQQGGNIGVSSTAGLGSEFWFTLPFRLTAEAELIPAPQPAVAKIPALNVLVVDDVTINQKLAMGQLQADSHRVFVAGNGREALDIIQQQAIDLVLMDLHMPVMDGLEATKEIRGLDVPNCAHVPIIGISANISEERRRECLESGMNAVSTKPVDSLKLNKIIADVILPDMNAMNSEEKTGLEYIDAGLMNQHKSSLGADAAAALYEEAEISAKKRINGIIAAYDQRDLDAIKGNAHALAGLCANFGFSKLRDVAISLENAGQSRDTRLIEQMIGTLESVGENSFLACREELLVK